MKKILILTASYGDGHNAAARSVRDAIALLEPTASAQLVDLFEIVQPTLNSVLKKGYQTIVRFAPALWSGVYRFFDKPALFQRQMRTLGKLRRGLADLLSTEQPDTIVSTYPVYAHLITQLFPDEPRVPFRVITVITDSISVCSAWYLTNSHLFVVANNATTQVLVRGGVPSEKVRALGFPVSPLFAQGRTLPREGRRVAARPRLLYVINTGKAQAGRTLQRLLALNHLEITITTGRNESLRAKLTRQLREYGHRVRILGWTDQMPQLLMSHDLLIAKAGGAMVQEAIAACCPMIINQIIPGQEEGNAELIESLGAGVRATREKDVADLVQEAFAENGKLWQHWRNNLQKVSRPDSALRIAELVLESKKNDKIRMTNDVTSSSQTCHEPVTRFRHYSAYEAESSGGG